MTSSLVGSEMCIRDRHLGELQLSPTHMKLISGNGMHLVALGSWLLYVPVSYTHLTLPTICSV
eukprot:4894559-Prorocentrum_lima.AAC.1